MTASPARATDRRGLGIHLGPGSVTRSKGSGMTPATRVAWVRVHRRARCCRWSSNATAAPAPGVTGRCGRPTIDDESIDAFTPAAGTGGVNPAWIAGVGMTPFANHGDVPAPRAGPPRRAGSARRRRTALRPDRRGVRLVDARATAERASRRALARPHRRAGDRHRVGVGRWPGRAASRGVGGVVRSRRDRARGRLREDDRARTGWDRARACARCGIASRRRACTRSRVVGSSTTTAPGRRCSPRSRRSRGTARLATSLRRVGPTTS